MESYDCLVVGAGLAGLQCARLLGGYGLRTLLVDQKASLEQAVHTSGIFVRRSLEDFALPTTCLGAPIRHVTLYSPRRKPLDLESPQDEFRIAQMGPLYARLLRDCLAAGVEWLPSTQFLAAEPSEHGSRARLRTDHVERTIQARFLIAADGARSRVARVLGLSVNNRFIVGLEEVLADVPLVGAPRLHCFLDHRLAPGYLAWVAQDEHSIHIGVGGDIQKFSPAVCLQQFRQSLRGIVDLDNARLVERRGGRIPIGGVLPRLATARGLLIGDAAGAVSPLTAGGLDPCLRLSQFAARVTWHYLNTGETAALAGYDGRYFRQRMRSRQALRWAFSLLGHNVALEAAFAFLRSPPGRRLASKVFFGRGSFPDVASLGPRGMADKRPALRAQPQNA